MNNHSKSLQKAIETLLWSEWDNADEQGGAPLDANYTIDDIDPVSLAKLDVELDAFIENAQKYLVETDPDHVEHDFILTRNRHGAGFWDGDYTNGDALTDLAQTYSEMNVYVGDDGRIYFD